MAHIRLDDNQIELSAGELRIGTDDDAGVRLEGGPEKGKLAIITVDPRGSATVRRAATGTTALVDGVALGAEPAPLLLRNRIDVTGRQLRFSDDRKAGSTVLTPAFGTSAAAPLAANGDRGGVSRGRPVSLVDGRGYVVPQSGLRIGRDVDCDIVVPGTEVPRHHAEISVTAAGYVHEIRGPLAHVRRGPHNDVVMRDDSIFRLAREVAAPWVRVVRRGHGFDQRDVRRRAAGTWGRNARSDRRRALWWREGDIPGQQMQRPSSRTAARE